MIKFFSKNINKNWSGKPNASVSKTLFLTYDLCYKCVIYSFNCQVISGVEHHQRYGR